VLSIQRHFLRIGHKKPEHQLDARSFFSLLFAPFLPSITVKCGLFFRFLRDLPDVPFFDFCFGFSGCVLYFCLDCFTACRYFFISSLVPPDLLFMTGRSIRKSTKPITAIIKRLRKNPPVRLPTL